MSMRKAMAETVLPCRTEQLTAEAADSDTTKAPVSGMTRRRFLQSTVTMAAMPLFASGSAYAAVTRLGQPATAKIYSVVSDSRFGSSVAFGRQFERIGIRHEMTDGDITRLWYECLAPMWSKEPIMLVGMTTPRTLLCLEQLAGDYAMRVATRVEHIPSDWLGVEHQLHVPEELKSKAMQMLRERENWSASAAQLVLECADKEPLKACNEISVRLPVRAHAYENEVLVSWLIAPVRRG